MANKKFKTAIGYVLFIAGVLLLVSCLFNMFCGKSEASVLEKLTSIRLYTSQDSWSSSNISAFNDGGTPGIIVSASKVIIGDTLYVGSSDKDARRVLTEDDIDKLKDQIREQVISELKESGRLK